MHRDALPLKDSQQQKQKERRKGRQQVRGMATQAHKERERDRRRARLHACGLRTGSRNPSLDEVILFGAEVNK